MASYQARQRDPLFDSNTQAVIEKRGKELLGVGLFVTGIAFVLLLATYAPTDPSLFSATDEPIQNALGRIGAAIASPLQIIAGLGSWAIAMVLLVWGLRFITHRGEERAISRIIFAPIGIALVSIYASTLNETGDWGHSFGLGGLFGDAFSGAILSVVQDWGGVALWLKILSAVSGISMLAMMSFVLGVTGAELKRFARFLLIGLVMTYAVILRLMGRGAVGTLRAAQALNEGRLARRERQAESAQAEAEHAMYYSAPSPAGLQQPRVNRAEPVVTQTAAPPVRMDTNPLIEEIAEEPARPGFLASLIKRNGVTEPIEEEPIPHDSEDDRIKAKISDAIKARMRQGQVLKVSERSEPVISRDRGPQPLLLDDQPSVTAMTAPEPAAIPSAPAAAIVPVAEPAKPVVQHMPKKAVQPSRRAQAEAQPKLQFDDKPQDYEHPPLNLLRSPEAIDRHHLSDEALEENARMLENVLDDYGVKGEIVSVRPGPVVTMYELEPAPGLKASRVIGLADDIARSMSALSARVSTVPGRSVIGIELPNEKREMVVLREILSGRGFGDGNQRLPLALGKDIGGEPIVANLAKMPHLLIAGTTGSGKSVAINTMILSLLYKLSPEECRMIMIDRHSSGESL